MYNQSPNPLRVMFIVKDDGRSILFQASWIGIKSPLTTVENGKVAGLLLILIFTANSLLKGCKGFTKQNLQVFFSIAGKPSDIKPALVKRLTHVAMAVLDSQDAKRNWSFDTMDLWSVEDPELFSIDNMLKIYSELPDSDSKSKCLLNLRCLLDKANHKLDKKKSVERIESKE